MHTVAFSKNDPTTPQAIAKQLTSIFEQSGYCECANPTLQYGCVIIKNTTLDTQYKLCLFDNIHYKGHELFNDFDYLGKRLVDLFVLEDKVCFCLLSKSESLLESLIANSNWKLMCCGNEKCKHQNQKPN